MHVVVFSSDHTDDIIRMGIGHSVIMPNSKVFKVSQENKNITKKDLFDILLNNGIFPEIVIVNHADPAILTMFLDFLPSLSLDFQIVEIQEHRVRVLSR